MNFTEEKVASVSATVMTLEVNFNIAEIKFVSRICERGVYEPVPEFQECMECLQVISRRSRYNNCSVFPGYTKEGLSDYCDQISFLSVINVCLVT